MGQYEYDELSESLSRYNMLDVQKTANNFWFQGCLPLVLSAFFCTLGSQLPIEDTVVREGVRWGTMSVLTVLGSLYMINFWNNRNISE